jgi:pheromone shutdown protein TraB
MLTEQKTALRAWLGKSWQEKFPAAFTALVILLSCAGLFLDISLKDGHFWFQRSGALLTLAGVELQYAKLLTVWRMQLGAILDRESVQSRLASGKGVGLLETAREAEDARNLAQSLYNIITGKSAADIWAVALIVVGTLIWGFADLPFKA